MTPRLLEMFRTGMVTDGNANYPLHSNIQLDEGELIQRVIAKVQPSVTLEVGMAYGVSTLFICEALSRLSTEVKHIAIDPNQTTGWRGIGLANVRAAGYEGFLEFHEEGSEVALPKLAAMGRGLDVAFIDGWHTFDHALVDFFYINRMLRVGGVVIFDDVNYESIHRLIRLVLTYPAYELFDSVVPHLQPASVLGSLRRFVAQTSLAKKALKYEFICRPWDVNWGSCVALRKVAADQRSFDWYEDF